MSTAEVELSTARERSDSALSETTTTTTTNNTITAAPIDTQLTKQIDQEYEWALEERDVAFQARYQSVRQSAACMILFMLLFLTASALFFVQQTEDWEIADALLYSVYTMTTVGYGHLHSPDTPAFQLYTIFFILTGIATLTILVAQVYQCLALEASRAQSERESHRLIRQSVVEQWGDRLHVPTHTMDRLFVAFEKLQSFLKEDEVGRGLSVLFPFVGLIGIGALVVGPLEGWTVVESLYFCVVSLTTVGFGDYYPTQAASIWFCILWLPFSVGFMSLYLTNVAAFYIRLSDANILRMERQLRKRRVAEVVVESSVEHDHEEDSHHHHQQQQHEEEETDPESSSGEAEEPSNEHTNNGFQNIPSRLGKRRHRRHAVRRLFGTLGSAKHRRERILRTAEPPIQLNTATSTCSSDSTNTTTAQDNMTTMREVLQAVHANLGQPESDSRFVLATSEFVAASTDTNNADAIKVVHKPSFALRALVQERFAEIIATDVAGYQNAIEIQDRTLSMTIDSLKQTADRWKIPKRARKAFRAVAFEVLFFVGEFGLVTRGADALFDLPPLVFSSLFAPLLAAMGDAPFMESWLLRTQVLADVDLQSKPRVLDMDHVRSAVAVSPHPRTAHLAVGAAQMTL